MKKISITYNPYKLETAIKIDGKAPAQNSKISEKSVNGTRLQEWIEELPRILIEEYNDIVFEVIFHGIQLDYDDLVAVFVITGDKVPEIIGFRVPLLT